MEKLNTIEPELAKIRDARKKIQADLDVVKRFIEGKEEIIQSVKADSQAQRNKQSEVREAAEVYTAVIEKSNEQISEIYKTKDKLREEHFQNKFEFEIQNDRVRWIKKMAAEQRRLSGKNEDKQARKEKL